MRSFIDFNSIDLGINDERNETLPECSMSRYAISLSDIILALILSDWAAYQEKQFIWLITLEEGWRREENLNEAGRQNHDTWYCRTLPPHT